MGGRPSTGSSNASVAYTYAQQPARPPTSQSFRSKTTVSRPGTGESNVTSSSEQIQYLSHPPGDASASSSVTTHVDDDDDRDREGPLPAISATSLNTTTTETRAESSTTHTHAERKSFDRLKVEGNGPPRLFLAGDDQPRGSMDATSLKDDVDYTPGWIGSLLVSCLSPLSPPIR